MVMLGWSVNLANDIILGQAKWCSLVVLDVECGCFVILVRYKTK